MLILKGGKKIVGKKTSKLLVEDIFVENKQNLKACKSLFALDIMW